MRNNGKDRVDIYINRVFWEIFVEAIVENQMTCPQIVIIFSEAPYPCACFGGVHSWGDFIPL